MRRVWAALVIVAVAVGIGRGMAEAQAPASATVPGGGLRIGFVDVQRVLARSAAGVAARDQLEREKAAMQKEVDGRRVEIDKLREELEKKGPLMTGDSRREKEEQLERKRRDATRMMDDFQRELAKKEQILAQKVLQEVAVVVERIGKQKAYFMIVERRGAGVLYFSPDADLTEEIIRAYDQESVPKGKK